MLREDLNLDRRRPWAAPEEATVKDSLPNLLLACSLILFGVLSVPALGDEPQGAAVDGIRRIVIGESVIPLTGPWKYQAGDSPVRPGADAPLWAESGFDDSRWETLGAPDTRSTQGTNIDEAGLLSGETVWDQKKQWGFAWYRVRLILEASPGERFALAGPEHVDAYQVFVNGRLLGGFGDFSSRPPATYYKQPTIFPLAAGEPKSAGGSTVIAFRVWKERNPLLTSHGGGGLPSIPLLGEVNAVTVRHQERRQELVRAYSTFVIDALIYGLLAIVAFSLILFDRTDQVYTWIGLASSFTAAYSTLGAFDVWTQHVSIFEDWLLVRCFLGPLAYVCWFMVWWAWFGRTKPRWMPFAALAVTVSYVISYIVLLNLFFSPVPNAISLTLEIFALIARLAFFSLLISIGIQGIRTAKADGWLVLPVILLLGIAPFQYELLILHLSPSWLIFRTKVDLPDLATLTLGLIVALLLLRRLLLSVRRQRIIEMDAKRAKLQSDFLAAVSHEFRSPLTTLRSFTELLMEGRITDKASLEKSYVHLDRETARLQRLVEDLLDRALNEFKGAPYRLSTFNAFKAARDAISDLSEEAQATGFIIETDFADTQAPVHADEEAVRRAIRNLIENAMKYSPQCRTVWVEGKADPRLVSISVRDRGMGIDPTEQEAIFQRFIRGEAAKRAVIKGTGLGLTMVKDIAQAMGGEIRVESEVDVGTTFILQLPLATK